MTRKELSPISPDGTYGLNWGSDGYIDIIHVKTGEEIGWLYENSPRWIIRAAFSHDMRRILCLNWDGSVGVWSMPRKMPLKPHIHNIVDFLSRNEGDYSLRRQYD